MAKTAIISVDGHVKASRAQFRDYIEKEYLDAYDAEVKRAEEMGMPDAGNQHPNYAPEVQWDSELRAANLETKGVVAEVLFPNGIPFQFNTFDDAARGDRERLEVGRRAYNRWLVDFCNQAPGRRKGQLVISLDDLDQTVRDIHWAKEQGLGGISLPAPPEGQFLFDPKFDQVWAAAQDVDLTISQHGGAGLPAYNPPGFALILTLMTENAFYSARSLWQMLAGGAFDRFPRLRVAYVETQIMFLVPAIANLDMILKESDEDNDVISFAKMMQRSKTVERLPSEYFNTNIFVGLSPFSTGQMPEHMAGGNPLGELLGKRGDETLPGFHIGVDACMFGVDYPHIESIYDTVDDKVGELVSTPGVSEADARKILFDNAAKLYDFDVAALAPHVERAGFEVSEVLVGTA